jgi:CBS domain-containing protein
MRVADVMSRAMVADSANDALSHAADLMWSKQTGSLLVMEDGALLGIITERDVMKAVARGVDLDQTPVSAVMTTSVLTVTPETELTEAARHMADRWIRHLPVVVDGEVAGMVSQRDLCRVFADLVPDE